MFYFFLSKGVTNVLLITQLLYYVEPVIKPLTYTQKVLVSFKKTGFLFFFFKLVLQFFWWDFSLCDAVQFTDPCILQYKKHICKAFLFLRRQILKWSKTAISTYLSKLRIRLEETWFSLQKIQAQWFLLVFLDTDYYESSYFLTWQSNFTLRNKCVT